MSEKEALSVQLEALHLDLSTLQRDASEAGQAVAERDDVITRQYRSGV